MVGMVVGEASIFIICVSVVLWSGAEAVLLDSHWSLEARIINSLLLRCFTC